MRWAGCVLAGLACAASLIPMQLARHGNTSVWTDCPTLALVRAQVPFHCPGLGRALPAALAHSPCQTRQLMRRLPRSDLIRLRLGALCLTRAQRSLEAPLPAPILQQTLCLALDA